MRAFPATGSGLARLHACAATLALLGACAQGGSDPLTSGDSTKWIGAWATSQGAAELPGYSDRSFRMIARPHHGGSEVRLRFANFYGMVGQPVTLTDVRLGLRSDATADTGRSSMPEIASPPSWPDDTPLVSAEYGT